ncbi:MAG: type II toxin-antitoxin system MqsA family antitoxin [Spirochaetes bacterium]|nr:type II toxin-antitoxin system MqsA family antitoxin [Spirochaetota bacterium]
MNAQSLCPLCSANKKFGTTTFTVELGFGVIVIRNVPAEVCEQCGESWIDDIVSEKLELIVDEARKHHPVVEVSSWEDVKDKIAS